MVTIKKMVKEQFNYCKAIADDIIKNKRSKEIQEYAQGFAEIESNLLGVDVDWIRINWGDIYIFIHDNRNIEYQLDPLGEYGGEMIDTYSEKEFWEQLDALTDDEIIDNHYCEWDDYSKDCPGTYVPFKV